MIKTEWEKIRRNLLPYIILCCIPIAINSLLVFDLHFRYSYLLNQKDDLGFTYWQLIFKEQNIFMINQFIPLIATMFVFLVFYVETKYNGWINLRLYSSDVNRIIVSKFVITSLFVVSMIIISCITIIPVGRITGVTTPVEWELFAIVFFTLVMSGIATSSVAFLIISFASKSINVITISCFLFLLSSILQNVDQKIMVMLNPFSFATLCYTQDWQDVLIHLFITGGWVLICLFICMRRMEHRKELV